ncbi:MAG: SMP-30/gluconolactonase/LRE family protein, partial [Hyphomicrobiaceae bacterium]
SEHLAHKVWEFSVGKTLQIQSKRVILDVSRQLRDWGIEYPETGPDGIEIRNDGSLLIAIYGAGRVIALEKGKPPRVLRVPMKFVTNMAATPEKVAVVGSYVNDRLPLTGEVQIWDRKNFDKALMSATR